MKKPTPILMSLLLAFCGLFTLANAQNLAHIYLNEGLEAVGIELEKSLARKDFWEKELGDKNVTLGYYEGDVTLVVTNKTNKTFKVFFYNDGVLSQKFDRKVGVTGLMGDKVAEGDLKTPVGFYDLGREFSPEDPYYGGIAFATDYPNLLDRVNDRTGGGIWIHGYPLGGERLDEFKTRGCIALYNDTLREFATLIKPRRKVFAMTEERDVVRTNSDEIAALLASLFEWKEKWRISDIEAYLNFYDSKNFRRFDKKNFAEFAAMKRVIFARKENKTIKFSRISIAPYPSVDGRKLFKITFYQDYYTPNHQFRGNKMLYVWLSNGKMKILAEK